MGARSRTQAAARRRVRNTRKLQVEPLESRLLLAGDTYLVNFQFNEAPTPTRYSRDVGAVFGDRGNGLSFGWNVDHTDPEYSLDRSVLEDQRLDTLIEFRAGAIWEIALPDGQYEVLVVVGDPLNNDAVHTLNVEGVNYWNAVQDPAGPLTMTKNITVSDGRLTLNNGAAPEKATRINYMHIVGLSDGSNAKPAAPTITEPHMAGQVLNPGDVHMEAVGFSDGDGNLHKSSDWEIRTVDPGAQIVWQTLGIEGVERLHTHQGDGIFVNSHAGRTEFLADTDYELFVRFRDDVGSVSNYASRTFHTGEASSIFPLQLLDVVTIPAPTWIDVFTTPVDLPTRAGILSPGNPIIAIDLNGDSSYPGNENPPNAVDGTLDKYLNFGEADSGFIVAPSAPSVVKSFQITTANDAEERDPTSYQLFGTNDNVTSTDNSDGSGESWTLVSSGALSLPAARNTLAGKVSIANNTSYKSYRVVFPTVKNGDDANSMQIAEIQFFGDDAGATAPSLRIESGSTGEPLLSFVGTDAPGNLVNHFAALADHANARIVIQGGSGSLNLNPSNLVFTDDQGVNHTVYLPAVNLGPNGRLDLWVAADGATYFGTVAQTAPEFSDLARPSDSSANVPFTALQPGYAIDVVAGGLQLPTNIAFVSNPGPNPSDPYFYVTELYGTIKVVSRDFTVTDYATGLLNFNPTGSFPGSGEQGLTGIVVDPVSGDVFVTRVTATNPANPNGAHHPQVVRFHSNDGGKTAASTTVILNMPGENQGQSHQISNLTIGPADGKLYVHNGDGFDFTTAQNLDSYRGKILRLNLNGSVPQDNPFYSAANGINSRDYVYAYGFRNPFGGDWRQADGKHYEVENGPNIDRFVQVNAGVDYLWGGEDNDMLNFAIYNWDPSHGPVNMAFIQQGKFSGSQFPSSKMDHMFISESGPTYGEGPQQHGKRIVEFALNANGTLQTGPTTLVEYTGNGRGTVVGFAAGPDGLYFTELYKDLNAVTPIDAGARVFRVRYVGQQPGDFDQDADADGADFLKWQRSVGSTTNLAADGNRDRIIDGGDLSIWKQNYASGAAAAAVQASSAFATGESHSPSLGDGALAESLASLAMAGAPSGGTQFGGRDAYRPPLARGQWSPTTELQRTAVHDLAIASLLDDRQSPSDDRIAHADGDAPFELSAAEGGTLNEIEILFDELGR